jgi:catalase (peroxidase I)
MSFLDAQENTGITDSIAPKWVQNARVAMTQSDKIALAAQVAMTHCGGPKMAFRAGRQDTRTPTSPTGLIPAGNATLEQLRPSFTRMGWTNEDIVALVTGSHTMGYYLFKTVVFPARIPPR